MNRFIELLGSDFCTSLLTALLHTLWQAMAIAGLLLLFLRSKAAKNANIRYMVALTALTAILFFGLFTWAVLQYESPATTKVPSIASSTEETASTTVPAGSSEKNVLTGAKAFEPEVPSGDSARFNWRTWVVGAWLIGVAVMLLRAVYIAAGGAKLRRQCRPLEDKHILALVEQLRQCLGIARRIRVAVSEHIAVPGVVGCIWPTLLLPASMISGIPADDLRAILAHELAHIRRYDYLVNFCQMVIEAILFFNPAVWWISKQIRFEREACCDQAGISATGQRIRYAEVLADWAHRVKKGNVIDAIPAIGFGKADDKGGLLERVRRIIVAGHRPRLKVSWYIATITLILSAAVLVGLWRGTTMTIALAGKLLTPQQRIDAIRQIEKDHLIFEKRQYTQEDQITISARVKTIDGKPLGRMSFIRLSSQGLETSSTKDIQISRGDSTPFQNDGLVSAKVAYGAVWLHVTSEGYAPAFAGPLMTEPGGEIKDLTFILDKGFQGKLRIVNEDRESISGAKLIGSYILRPGVTFNDINLTTDETGLAIVEHAAGRPARFTVTAEGYEVKKFGDIQLSSEHPAVLELTRARETTGVVLSKETDRPVRGAEIKVLMTDGPSGSHSYGPEEGKILTTTDNHGRFALRTLRSDSRYLLTVEADGLGHKLLYNVTAGQEDIKVDLPGELRIKGRTKGPVEKLRKRDGNYVIRYGFGISFGDHSHWASGKKAIVEVRDGQGYFEIANIAGNRVSIGSGSYRKVLNIESELHEEVLIDLTDPVTTLGQEYKNRELIVRFDYPEGSPAPQGNLILKYIEPEFATNTYKNHDLAIRNGQGQLKIPTPGKVAYDNSGIAGYWFGEKSGIKVSFAEEPFVLTIPAVPAGSIYGEVLEHDGSKTHNVLVSVVVVEKSPLMGESPSLNVDGKNSAGNSELDARYVLSPLPLGGKYVVIAHRQDLYMVSDPIELNETGPIQRLDMTLEKGITFEIKIVDEDGKPKPSVPVWLDYNTPWHHGFSREASYTTNSEGKFVVDRFNPKVPGVYQVIVKDLPGYRPVKKKIEDFDKPLVIKLERGHIVKGIVVDNETGWPIPGIEVYALPKDFSYPEPTTYLEADEVTDENGKFQFSTMARREYNLDIRSGQLADHRNSAVVTDGDQKQIILRVKLSKRSRLKPRNPAER